MTSPDERRHLLEGIWGVGFDLATRFVALRATVYTAAGKLRVFSSPVPTCLGRWRSARAAL
jgi:hypothetical protein